MPNFSGVWTLKQATDAKQANNWPGAPTEAPTIGTATAGEGSASVTFTGISDPSVTSYRVTSTPGGFTATGTTSPISVTGLTNGTAYTFTVAAGNSLGYGPESAASNSVTPEVQLKRGLILAGAIPPLVLSIDYIDITTTGNSTNFGSLSNSQYGYGIGSCGSTTRAIFSGGNDTNNNALNIISYVTFATTGNSIDFGDQTVGRNTLSACNSSTRGIFGGGRDISSRVNIIDYITIASIGNATDFGDLTTNQQNLGSCSSSTRGIFAGGFNGASILSLISYVTIASTGNAINFGNLPSQRNLLTACSNSTRGLFAGGQMTSQISYITISSTGDSINFGDLTSVRYSLSGLASETRGVFCAGIDGSYNTVNTIDYVTIASTGNATDFGDLSSIRENSSACSNCNGGVQ